MCYAVTLKCRYNVNASCSSEQKALNPAVRLAVLAVSSLSSWLPFVKHTAGSCHPPPANS